MTETQQLSPAGRITLWVLGTLLFLDIAIYPYYLYMEFAQDSELYTKVGIATVALFGLIWLATAFGPLKTRQ